MAGRVDASVVVAAREVTDVVTVDRIATVGAKAEVLPSIWTTQSIVHTIETFIVLSYGDISVLLGRYSLLFMSFLFKRRPMMMMTTTS